jgi:hypothetical protein
MGDEAAAPVAYKFSDNGWAQGTRAEKYTGDLMFRSIAISFGLCFVTASAQAALEGRAPMTPGGADYQAYYDTSLNITWLANANLAASNTFGIPRDTYLQPVEGMIGATGLMSWHTAQTWFAAMNAAGYLRAGNWRLPTTAQPDPTCGTQFNPGASYPTYGGGYGCTGSEMGHLRTVDGVVGSGPVQNVYWTGTTYAPQPNYAWVYYLRIGYQLQGDKNYYNYAWPVSPGDLLPVPIPPAAFLFPSALAALGWVKRRFN